MKALNILIGLLCVLTIISCKEDKIPQEFSVACKGYTVGAKGGNFTASVISNYDWTAFSKNDWITVVTHNNEDDYVKISVGKNTTLEDRTGSVVIQSGDLSHSITISQECNSEIIISETNYKLSDEGGSISVEVNTNGIYGIKITEEWIQKDASSRAMKEYTHVFIVSPNDTYEDRSGYIIFEMKDKADTVKVWQCQKNGLILTEKERIVHENGEQISFEVKANINYSYHIEEECDWISEINTRGLVSHFHTFTFERNDSRKNRVAKIFFKNNDSNLQEVLTITQAGQMSILKVTHSNIIWDIPILKGNNIIGNVNWGDGNEPDEYSIYLTHQYDSSNEYKVEISARDVEAVKLDNLIKVSTIDLSNL